MSESVCKTPMNVLGIFSKSLSFVFKNILWLIPIGALFTLSNFPFKILYPELLQSPWVYGSIIGLELICLTISPLIGGVVAVMIGEQCRGREITLRQALRMGIRKWISLIILTLLIVAAFILGFLLLFIPSLIVMCATFCAVPAMMLEDLDSTQAFARSWEMTKKNRLRIFGYLSLAVVLYVALVGGGSFILLSVNPFILIGFSILFYAISLAFWPSVQTLIFLDLRERQEKSLGDAGIE